MDNLNTHSPASLYKAFQPEEARRILNKLEFHYTPKHGSWLNMAEIELSILSRQCLNRRIPNQEILKSEISAWEKTRNQEGATVDWRFTNDNARVKLNKLYPKMGQEGDNSKNNLQSINESAIAGVNQILYLSSLPLPSRSLRLKPFRHGFANAVLSSTPDN